MTLSLGTVRHLSSAAVIKSQWHRVFSFKILGTLGIVEWERYRIAMPTPHSTYSLYGHSQYSYSELSEVIPSVKVVEDVARILKNLSPSKLRTCSCSEQNRNFALNSELASSVWTIWQRLHKLHALIVFEQGKRPVKTTILSYAGSLKGGFSKDLDSYHTDSIHAKLVIHSKNTQLFFKQYFVPSRSKLLANALISVHWIQTKWWKKMFTYAEDSWLLRFPGYLSTFWCKPIRRALSLKALKLLKP